MGDLEEAISQTEERAQRRAESLLADMTDWVRRASVKSPDSPDLIGLVLAAIRSLDIKLEGAAADLKAAVKSNSDLGHRVQGLEEWKTGITWWVRSLTVGIAVYVAQQILSGHWAITSQPLKP